MNKALDVTTPSQSSHEVVNTDPDYDPKLDNPELLSLMTREEIEEFHGLFAMFDINGDGDISV